MLVSKAELAGFGIGIVVVVIMGIIALAGPFHNINKTQAAIKVALVDKMVNVPNNSNSPYQFAPRNFTVKLGQSVTFKNVSDTDHTATERNLKFNSQNVAPGQSWVFTPKHAGKFAYYCEYHPYMTGIITVTK